MKKFPQLSLNERICAACNMSSFYPPLLGVISLIIGIWSLMCDATWGLSFFVLGVLFIGKQIVTRLQHIKTLPAIRQKPVSQTSDGHTPNCLEVRIKGSDRWVTLPINNTIIKSIRKKHFPYSSPWRCSTIGYPGIEIVLDSSSNTIEHLFPYGCESQQQKAFEYLSELFPGKAILSENEDVGEDQNSVQYDKLTMLTGSRAL